MLSTLFSLRKPRHTFRHIHRLYKRKAKGLDISTQASIEQNLAALREAILKKDPHEAKQVAHNLERAAKQFMPKSSFDKAKDFVGGILFALLVAVLIRTMWFELYTIPTGSMRPTLKEQDFLVVSKTDFGINVPLSLSHFYFDPSLVQRGSIVVFSGENMDIPDVDTLYFYLFPGKKQLVKRLIGKPGDTLYFYGGSIYGIDAAGNEITAFREWKNLEHIPFIRFDGKAETPTPPRNGLFPSVLFHQMNQPVAKLSVTPAGTLAGEMLSQHGRPPAAQYSDLWGMKHFAMASLLTKEQLTQIHPTANLEEGLLYLELTHHPTLQGAQIIRDEQFRLRPELAVTTSLIPLQQRHLDAIAQHMTTCRFIVKRGVAYRYGWNPRELTSHLPRLPDVPDGTYEILDGTIYRLPFTWLPIFGGFSYKVAASHPLYKWTPERIQLFYDLGIEFLDPYLPHSKNQRAAPSRYAYFKNQELYLLAAPILTQGDPTLLSFLKQEREKPTPFIDAGPPTLEEIRKNGIQIPEKMYLALGDNHAMSADGRQFGFIPEENLKGSVSFLFSPPGERWGTAPQPSKRHFTLPTVTVWSAFILILFASSWYYRRQFNRPFLTF